MDLVWTIRVILGYKMTETHEKMDFVI